MCCNRHFPCSDKVFFTLCCWLNFLLQLWRQTCLVSSHLSSIFCCDDIFLCHKKNLLLSNFYCRDRIFLYHDRDFCLHFFILSQHEFLCSNILFVIFSTFVATIFIFVVKKFTSASCCACRDIKLLCHDKVFLSPIPSSECYVAT